MAVGRVYPDGKVVYRVLPDDADVDEDAKKLVVRVAACVICVAAWVTAA